MAAPLLADGVRSSPSRLRKRGPRSFSARSRRFDKFVQKKYSLHVPSTSSTSFPVVTLAVHVSSVLPQFSTSVPCAAEPLFVSSVIFPSDFSTSFSLLHVNIRGWRLHVDELSAYIHMLKKRPSFIAVLEPRGKPSTSFPRGTPRRALLKI